jgi:hypothetical protein
MSSVQPGLRSHRHARTAIPTSASSIAARLTPRDFIPRDFIGPSVLCACLWLPGR